MKLEISAKLIYRIHGCIQLCKCGLSLPGLMYPDSDKDLYRETPVRYLGYANEVGEAFRSIIKAYLVKASYGVAILYVLADTQDKTFQANQEFESHPRKIRKVVYTGVDTLTWQMLASVVIPGLTINRTCALSTYILNKANVLTPNVRRWTVVGIGLASIPFIIHPIDNLVDKVLDNTIRKWKP